MIQFFMIISVVNCGFSGAAVTVLSLRSSLRRFTTRIKVFITSPPMFEQVGFPRAPEKAHPLQHKHSFCCAYLKNLSALGEDQWDFGKQHACQFKRFFEVVKFGMKARV
jgi:hypothetical protein